MPSCCWRSLALPQRCVRPFWPGVGRGGSFYKPYGTTLRMGRLGYQSDAQATLGVSYNGLEGYAASLHDALTRPWPAYEAIGIRNPGGDYNQLATTLLQIENEFYGTIRPKRVIRPGERPLHALRERGVEYVEVRLLDLNPFETIGIAAPTLRFLDVFLMHCLLSESPPDTPDEIHEITQNQQLTASRGREPGLRLSRHGESVSLTQWGTEIITSLMPIAKAMDAAQGVEVHVQAVVQAGTALAAPDTLPSARVLAAVQSEHGDSFVSFVRAQSLQTHQRLLAMPWSAPQQARYEAMAAKSLEDQRAIEEGDTMPFEIYREEYTSPARLCRAAFEPVHHDA